jgi:hypothetical protein
MRYNKLATTASLLALALGATACDDGLTDINRNPNQPETVSAQYLFPQGVTTAVGLIRGQSFDLHFASLWAQHIAKIQYVDEDRYDVRPQTIDAWWTTLYAGPLMDLQKTIEIAGSDVGAAAPAQVMQMWTFAQMTDAWGDIPFSEALKGEAGVTPAAYDSQQQVYDGILARLTSANTALSNASNSLGSADPIYAGRPADWQRFANSMRARYAMRLSKVDAAKAQAQVVAALNAPVFTSNAHNATLRWPGDGSNDNPYYTNFRTRDDHRVSKTLVDTLKSLNDPRLSIYVRPAADTNLYTGVPNGLTNAAAADLGLSRTSKVGIAFASATTPSHLMTYAELLFIRAEAAQRGWVTGNAAALYAQGITASMELLGVPAADITAYLAQPRVVYNPATGLQQIALQKWLSLFQQGSEAYAEVRRTGFPQLTPGPAAVTSGVFARRMPYPNVEQATNNTNLQAAISSQGNTTMVGRLWWDRP